MRQNRTSQGVSRVCPHCDSEILKKIGKTKSGFQRYLCKDCGKSFSENTLKKQKTLNFKNCIHFGLDYLSFMCTDFKTGGKEFESLFYGMNDTNTNVRQGCLFGYSFNITFNNTKNGCALYFDYDGDRLFSVEMLSRVQREFLKLPTRVPHFRWSFYGAFFSLVRMGAFHYEFLENFAEINPKITRLDFCFDFIDYSVEEVKEFYVMQKKKGGNKKESIFKGSDGKVQTWYLGDTRASKNNKFLVRVYDKLVEALSKQKEHYYPDYFKYGKITRFEVEIRSTTLREYKVEFDWLFDDKKIIDFVKSIMTSQYSFFKFDFGKAGFLEKAKIVHSEAGLMFFEKRLLNLCDRIKRLGYTDMDIFKLFAEKESREKVKELLEK